jgi:hypothetical protein
LGSFFEDKWDWEDSKFERIKLRTAADSLTAQLFDSQQSDAEDKHEAASDQKKPPAKQQLVMSDLQSALSGAHSHKLSTASLHDKSEYLKHANRFIECFDRLRYHVCFVCQSHCYSLCAAGNTLCPRKRFVIHSFCSSDVCMYVCM